MARDIYGYTDDRDYDESNRVLDRQYGQEPDASGEAAFMGMGEGFMSGMKNGNMAEAVFGGLAGGLWGSNEYNARRRAYQARRQAMADAIRRLEGESKRRSEARKQATAEQMGYLAPMGDLLGQWYGPDKTTPQQGGGDPFEKLQQKPTRDPFFEK